jgi:DNA polymerase-1
LQHPLADMILQFRKLQKLSSTWLDGLSAHVLTAPDPGRGSNAPVPRICSEWLQTSTRTGRLSSANPNFQNVPVKAFSLSLPDHSSNNELRDVHIAPRELFIARPGFVFLSCDYAQMEMRLLASLSKDAKLRAFIRRGRDIHKEVYWKKKPVESVTPEEREITKRVVYALMYGMGPAALKEVLKCSLDEARVFLSSFLSSYPQVRVWMEEVQSAAERNGYCVTISGRRRILPADQARHLSVNSVVQGSAADIMKQALIELHKRVAYSGDVLLVSTVHDEVILEVRADLIEQTRCLVVSVMESCGPDSGVLSVPLVATSKVGKNMGQFKERFPLFPFVAFRNGSNSGLNVGIAGGCQIRSDLGSDKACLGHKAEDNAVVTSNRIHGHTGTFQSPYFASKLDWMDGSVPAQPVNSEIRRHSRFFDALLEKTRINNTSPSCS